ncbi:hypothetical protein AB0I77_22965 [Streptomyces sp. NPDC050619]|uniref:hypothetical protein n=1 Tax=Streptomyces sp. NPDC050619 TaxID=3157214 RepID=UPI003433C13C
MRAAYLDGRTIAALAREHGVSRGAVRTAVTDLMPEHAAADEGTTAPELPVSLDMPGKVAGFLRATELDDAERAALNHGVTVRRCQGYTLRVTTSPAVHRQLLARCQPLDGAQGTPAVPAQRKARGSTRTAPTPSWQTSSAEQSAPAHKAHPVAGRHIWAMPPLQMQMTIFPRVRPRSACACAWAWAWAWAWAIFSRG